MTLTYKEIKINYKSTGKGRPIVFLHGFLENITMWEQTIALLENSYHCIAIDLLGHGDTESLGYIHTMENMALAVNTVLDELQITDLTLIGHSMGGYVSLAFVDLFPKKAISLILLNSTSYPDSEERKISRTRAIDIVKKNPNAYTSMAIANLFAEKNRIAYEPQIKQIKEQASKTSLQGIISALEGMKIRKDRSNILKEFNGSKVIFAGEKDPVLSFSQNEKEANYAKVDLISFDGGHMTYIENQKEFMAALQNHLQNPT